MSEIEKAQALGRGDDAAFAAAIRKLGYAGLIGLAILLLLQAPIIGAQSRNRSTNSQAACSLPSSGVRSAKPCA